MSRKPAYAYTFSTEKQAATFLDFAQNYYKSGFAQHPQRDAIPDKLRVLVTGTGSLLFDSQLKEALDIKATELGGVYQPSVR